MARIIVSPLAEISTLMQSGAVSHVLSLLSPDTAAEALSPFNPPSATITRHELIAFNDIDREMPGLTAPSTAHVAQIVAFTGSWHHDKPDDHNANALLIHCWAGISRSTAAAFIAICALYPQRCEEAIARELRFFSATATPNRQMIRLADNLLGRDGRMENAIAAIGRGVSAAQGQVFEWPLDGPE